MAEPDPFRSLYPDNPNIQKLHTVAGTPVTSVNRVNALGGNIEQAVWSTAPYKGRDKKLCMANKDTCKGKRANGTDYCIGHLRSFGLIENDKRAAPPSEGTWMTLDELRNFVRVQMDVDEEELPNTTIDNFLREAYDRTINTETRWPFFEMTWQVSNTGGLPTITIPLDVQPTNVMALIANPPESYQPPLVMIGHELAEVQFHSTADGMIPNYYSMWGGLLYLWPPPTQERVYTLRGYRKPLDWIGIGTNPIAVVDADPRLHQLLAHYAIALAYAQQEDDVLEDVYMKRWQNLINTQRHAIMEPAYNRPLVLSGGMTATWY